MPFFKVDSSTSVSDSKELSGFCTLTSGNAILFLLNFGRIRFRRGEVVLAVFSYENSVVVVVAGIVVVVRVVVVVVVVVDLVVVITGLLVEVECGYALMNGLLFSATVEDCCGVDLSISAAGLRVMISGFRVDNFFRRFGGNVGVSVVVVVVVVVVHDVVVVDVRGGRVVHGVVASNVVGSVGEKLLNGDETSSPIV